jgi:hypothetical protein
VTDAEPHAVDSWTRFLLAATEFQRLSGDRMRFRPSELHDDTLRSLFASPPNMLAAHACCEYLR